MLKLDGVWRDVDGTVLINLFDVLQLDKAEAVWMKLYGKLRVIKNLYIEAPGWVPTDLVLESVLPKQQGIHVSLTAVNCKAIDSEGEFYLFAGKYCKILSENPLIYMVEEKTE